MYPVLFRLNKPVYEEIIFLIFFLKKGGGGDRRVNTQTIIEDLKLWRGRKTL